MDHKILGIKATTTDLGEFTAIAAAYSTDRMDERIVPGAFAETIESWKATAKMIPLHWNHSGEAKDIIGVVDPATMEEVESGLQVRGKLDLEDSEVARDAWRLMKRDAVSLSFGYLVQEEAKGTDGIRELRRLDLFEITVTPAPVNPDTRFLALKSALLDPDAIQLSPEAVIAGDELVAAQAGELKAVWTTAYINDLPDSAFVDPETRSFPCRDATGAIDLPHLKSAIGRIPQSDLPQAVKDRVASQARQILENADKAITEDRQDHDRLAFELTTASIEVAPPEPVIEPEPLPELDLKELNRDHDRLAFELGTAGIDMDAEVQKEPTAQPTMAELRRQSYDLILESLISQEKQ